MATEKCQSGFRVLICDCEGTDPIDPKSIEKAASLKPDFHGSQLCRRQFSEVRSRLTKNAPLLIGCTQEAPLFLETAEEDAFDGDIRFVNIREKAGWSRNGAGAKMGAVIAEAMLDIPGPHAIPVTSGGAVMVIGGGDTVFEAARRLGQRMDVTLILERGAAVTAPRTVDVPSFSATGVRARGHLGAFEVDIDGFAAMTPSSRREISFAPAHRCSARLNNTTAVSIPIQMIPPAPSRRKATKSSSIRKSVPAFAQPARSATPCRDARPCRGARGPCGWPMKRAGENTPSCCSTMAISAKR
jgi:hypothetical protein